MSKVSFRASVSMFVLAATAAGSYGCVADRAARNGVFNENQYLRKAFIVRPGAPGPDGQPTQDSGWFLKATVTDVSSPNPIGGGTFGIFPGTQNSGELVRFEVTQDKLNMISMREISNQPSTGSLPSVVNAWPVTNVDIKYRINLDGEKTNFLEENQELSWKDRQWVKINFAKNDMSDVAPLGPWTSDALNKCADLGNASATLATDSFIVDEPHDYMQWKVAVTVPLKYDDATCVAEYGPMGDTASRLGRYSVTFNLMYSMTRATPASKLTYQPLEVAEKDPIRRKYGPIEFTTVARDNDTGMLAARELVVRFDPNKQITWYFDKGFPENYKHFFTDPGGIADGTNQLMSDAGVPARVVVKNFDQDLTDENKLPDGTMHPREFGDVRYSFLRWMNDKDQQDSFAGVTQFMIDPRTGEALNSSIVFNDFAIKDYYVQRLDAYLQSIGASVDVNSTTPWPDPGACKDGQVMPIDPVLTQRRKNANSPLYGKMQAYLHKPISEFGNLGPSDFIVPQDDDFLGAYYPLVAYSIFADPDQNPFVTREGGQGVYGPASVWQSLQQDADFHKLAADIDHGVTPFQDVTGQNGLKNATDFVNNFRNLTIAHRNTAYSRTAVNAGAYRYMDTTEAFSFEQVVAKDARHCIGGKWETKEQWIQNLIDTYWSQVAWHEFGHSLGLEHNFMASVDKPNFPDPTTDPDGNVRYGLYASSVMEYNAAPDRVFWTAGWAPYDKGAISWIYANNAPNGASSNALSGQVSPTAPWKDPNGFYANGPKAGQERIFLRCDERHLKYTPLCRQGDLGTTPSEIIANQIENYEWQYAWRNFRVYRKIWNNNAYADTPAGLITDIKRFLSMWAYDWSGGEIQDTLRRIGVKNPQTNGSDQAYYAQLNSKFRNEISGANQMVAAFHKAIIQQSAGERPYATHYDKFYGDEDQQGIILDKLFAMTGWTGLWPTDNYDQNQAGGYISSYSSFGEPTFESVSEDAVSSMVGSQYDVYPYFIPSAVALFAQDTHSPSFSGRIEVRDWIGGIKFDRLQDFLDYFRQIAVTNGRPLVSGAPMCPTLAGCTYDPRDPSISDSWNEFVGPDNVTYIWSYVPDRNVYVVARKDRNTTTYKVLHSYNDDIVHNLDDGSGGSYSFLLPVKYTLDSFTQYN